MDAGRWGLIKRLVDGALDQSPAHRDAWLAEACSATPDIIPDVRTLLRAAELTGGFLPSSGIADSFRSAPRNRGPADASRIGCTVAQYRLIEWLGAGGMGEVFRAQDLALGRDTALKLLPRDFSPGLRERLLREAEASARLQHPSIATFFEAGEADGETFIAMEFVQGRTLRERLGDGPIPFEEALSIARCLLEAVAHAHATGLVHRDMKPENVILTGRMSAKLLDFGIAVPLSARLDPAPATMSSQTAVVSDSPLAGTIGYLAPEQLAGAPIDARTDVFQLGAVLYEMVSGRPAFGGTSNLERLAAVMTVDPDMESVASAGAPADLGAVLRKALSRDPSARYSTASAFLRSIQDLSGGRFETGLVKIVAVLDFDGPEDTAWVGSAIADRLREDLSQRSGLIVLPRERVRREAEAARHEQRPADAVALGLRLGCGWTIAGTTHRVGGDVQVVARVMDVSIGQMVAEEEAAGPMSELFALQNRLASVLAGALNVAAGAAAVKGSDSILEAYECFARARPLVERISKGTLEEAREHLERAIRIDPGYADALALLSFTYGLRAIATSDRSDVVHALRFADRALAVDPLHVKAHVRKGYALWRLGRIGEASAAFHRAVALDATDTDALYFAGTTDMLHGLRRREALQLLQRAVESDPSQGLWWLALGSAHLCLDHRMEALYSFRRAERLESSPGRFAGAGAAAYAADVLRLDGQLSEARDASLAGIAAAERSDHAYRDTFRAHGLTVLGRVALDQHDMPAAQAAFSQVLGQVRGRPGARSCGHLAVQAQAGLAVATNASAHLEEALRMFDAKEIYSFEAFYGAMDDLTLFDLAHAALRLGRTDDSRVLLDRARQAGSLRSLPVT